MASVWLSHEEALRAQRQLTRKEAKKRQKTREVENAESEALELMAAAAEEAARVQAARVQEAEVECARLQAQLDEVASVSAGQVKAAKVLYEKTEKCRQAAVNEAQLARERCEVMEAKLSAENAALTKELAHLRTELLEADEDLEQLMACNRYQAGRIGEQEAELQSLRPRTDPTTSDPAGGNAGPKVGWSVQYDEQGRQYWKDERTGHTQWDRPAVLRQKKKSKGRR